MSEAVRVANGRIGFVTAGECGSNCFTGRIETVLPSGKERRVVVTDTARAHRPLRALLETIERRLRALAEAVERLYDDSFVGSGSRWAVPLLATLALCVGTAIAIRARCIRASLRSP